MSSHRWLLTGAGGMLGTDVRDELARCGDEFLALSRSELDVTDAVAVHACVKRYAPTIIVNCAAYTKVDLAETEPEIAAAINGTAVGHLARAADDCGAVLVQISSDFVFDGTKTTPYEPLDATNPLSVYGRTKLLGEQAASSARRPLVVRTSWLFGTSGPNFVEAIRNQIRKGANPLRVVHDQHGRPTYTPHLAAAIVRLARIAAANPAALGIVHYADSDACSWYDFASAIAEGSGVEVRPVTSAEFPRPAVRPPYSVLSTARYEALTGDAPASWRDGLREYVQRKP